jgi:hypothetical protein
MGPLPGCHESNREGSQERATSNTIREARDEEKSKEDDQVNKPKSVIVIALVALLSASAFAAKKPKPPSQEPITKECVTIYDIRFHGLSLLSGIAAPPPGLEAKIKNNCQVAVSVFLNMGYFDRNGVQFKDGIATATVGAGARYDLYHEATVFGLDQGSLKMITILSVKAYPAN